MVSEYKSFLKTVEGGEGDRCHYRTRLDMYGKGCQHNCQYCYARNLLDFRGLWDPEHPSEADRTKVAKALDKIPQGTVLRLGGMTDPYQPLENDRCHTRWLIGELNDRGIGYLIVTKSGLVQRDIDIMDPKLAHVQISYTFSDNRVPSIAFEMASLPCARLFAAELCQEAGLDTQVRLSPYIPELINIYDIVDCKVDKLLVEFLRINSRIAKQMPWLNTAPYTEKSGGYLHRPLCQKIAHLTRLHNITGKRITVCEDHPEHYEYFKQNWNPNPEDCCDLRVRE